MSWKAGVKTAGDSDFCFNALRFETEEEAKKYGVDLFSRWTAVKEMNTERSDDPTNYTFKDGKLTAI